VVLQGRYRASERLVCRVVGQHRSTQRPNGHVVPIEATAYVATHVDESLLPFTWHGALVIAGAVEHGPPIAYVNGLRAIEAKLDADAHRHALPKALASHR
jgi:hypothetical protein